MRAVAKEQDIWQIFIIFITIIIYYFGLEHVKNIPYPPFVQFCVVVFNYIGTIAFVYIFSSILAKKPPVQPFFYLFAYSLIPTIIWFYLNTTLFILVPPPRNVTLLGKIFSIVFITLSVSLLAWKVILLYLAVRFATGLKFYNILFVLTLYISLVIPYSLFLYHAGFFRIPFL